MEFNVSFLRLMEQSARGEDGQPSANRVLLAAKVHVWKSMQIQFLLCVYACVQVFVHACACACTRTAMLSSVCCEAALPSDLGLTKSSMLAASQATETFLFCFPKHSNSKCKELCLAFYVDSSGHIQVLLSIRQSLNHQLAPLPQFLHFYSKELSTCV